jgi:hypothetical protein
MRLLAKSPAERFADMAEFDRALAACESACRDVPALQLGRVQALVAGGEFPGSAPAPAKSRSLLPVAVIAGLAVALLVVVAVLGPQLRARKLAARDQNKPSPASLTPTPLPPVVAPVPPARPPAAPPAIPPVNGVTPVAGVTAVPPTPALPAAGKPGHRPTKPASPDSAKPHGETPGPAAVAAEPPEVKEKLNEAQKLLDSGDGMAAIDQAKRTLSDGKFSRAYRIMTLASCQSGNVGMAKTYFHNVAAADRSKVIKFCAQHDKELTAQ